MSSEIALELKNVNKTFWIREKSNDSIRERIKGVFSGVSSNKEIRALRNINLTINKGEFFGIVGHNGSGKSTLLKLIMGAIKPDKGAKIISNGKVLRLALGMGFDPNLSARHNIYVNGSIMGLTFKEIGSKFDEIIEFGGLEEFVDTPIKYYSSGMVSRLAFSIAMHVEADILLIDEFFGGVGDEAFKQKSSEKFKERILEGKTIVFVSHEMGLIEQYCNRVCVMNSGQIIAMGIPSDVIQPYINSYS
jgi:ABC-type polysaccharide/polyol phosphate transport system ATPase subunit